MSSEKAPTSATFERYRGSPPELYDRYFVPAIGSPFAAPVIDAAALRAGERVLDVACGTGVVARLAAERVGTDGTVVGIDGNPGMLQVARSATPAGATIEWHEASADGLPLTDDTFDVALCSLGLQFFADKVGALIEMGRVVVPGGRIVIGVPGPTPRLFEEFHDVLADRVGTDVAAFVHAVFSVDDPGRLADLMARAGLDHIETSGRPIRLQLAPPADLLWQYMLSTPLAAATSRLDTHERVALETEIVKRWEPFVSDGGIVTDVGLILATATASAA
jgi:SAM-dependent methyltransferase